jgi:hypothetical protein
MLFACLVAKGSGEQQICSIRGIVDIDMQRLRGKEVAKTQMHMLHNMERGDRRRMREEKRKGKRGYRRWGKIQMRVRTE